MNGFILTANSQDNRDNNQGIDIILWIKSAEGAKRLIFKDRPLFFVDHLSIIPEAISARFERKSLPLHNFEGNSVDALYFKSLHDYYETRTKLTDLKIRHYESDIRPHERFLMERFISGPVELQLPDKIKKGEVSPALKIISLDIETGTNGQIYSIAFHPFTVCYDGSNSTYKLDQLGEVMMLSDFVQSSSQTSEYRLTFYKDEMALLNQFMKNLDSTDPDLIIGWNVVGFDLTFLWKRAKELGVTLKLSRGSDETQYIEREDNSFFKIPGRVVVDGMTLMRNTGFKLPNFKLQTAAELLLKKSKDITATCDEDKVGEIERRFKSDKEALAKYNYMDCTLVSELFQKCDLFTLLISRTIYSSLTLDTPYSPVNSFDHFYLPRLHRKGRVAPNSTDLERGLDAQGGLLIQPTAGLYKDVVSLDFKSLYPTIMATFSIDPHSRLTAATGDHLKTPTEHSFSKSESILTPYLIELMQKRAISNEATSRAIKLQMNSFYGVMGTTLSRFYHADLPAAITGTGRFLLTLVSNFLKNNGHEVLYGDTDSVFVKLLPDEIRDGTAHGKILAKKVTEYLRVYLKENYKVSSFLDVEFDEHFEKIFFTLGRHSDVASKKRYVAQIKGERELHFKGMEFVRSDWTSLSKKYQYELYDLFFKNGDIAFFTREFIDRLRLGEFNDLLLLKAKLSTNNKTLLNALNEARGRGVAFGLYQRDFEYAQTEQGILLRSELTLDTKFNYEYYIEKQIRPIADSLFRTVGRDFDELTAGVQLTLF